MTSFRILALSLMAAASIAATAQDEADERSLQWYDMSSTQHLVAPIPPMCCSSTY